MCAMNNSSIPKRTFEVWELKNNFLPHFIKHVIT